MNKAVDKGILAETIKAKKELDKHKRLLDMRKELESDMEDLTEKFQNLSDQLESSHQIQKDSKEGRNEIKRNIIVRGLTESSGKNIECKSKFFL